MSILPFYCYHVSSGYIGNGVEVDHCKNEDELINVKERERPRGEMYVSVCELKN